MWENNKEWFSWILCKLILLVQKTKIIKCPIAHNSNLDMNGGQIVLNDSVATRLVAKYSMQFRLDVNVLVRGL